MERDINKVIRDYKLESTIDIIHYTYITFNDNTKFLMRSDNITKSLHYTGIYFLLKGFTNVKQLESNACCRYCELLARKWNVKPANISPINTKCPIFEKYGYPIYENIHLYTFSNKYYKLLCLNLFVPNIYIGLFSSFTAFVTSVFRLKPDLRGKEDIIEYKAENTRSVYKQLGRFFNVPYLCGGLAYDLLSVFFNDTIYDAYVNCSDIDYEVCLRSYDDYEDPGIETLTAEWENYISRNIHNLDRKRKYTRGEVRNNGKRVNAVYRTTLLETLATNCKTFCKGPKIIQNDDGSIIELESGIPNTLRNWDLKDIVDTRLNFGIPIVTFNKNYNRRVYHFGFRLRIDNLDVDIFMFDILFYTSNESVLLYSLDIPVVESNIYNKNYYNNDNEKAMYSNGYNIRNPLIPFIQSHEKTCLELDNIIKYKGLTLKKFIRLHKIIRNVFFTTSTNEQVQTILDYYNRVPLHKLFTPD